MSNDIYAQQTSQQSYFFGRPSKSQNLPATDSHDLKDRVKAERGFAQAFYQFIEKATTRARSLRDRIRHLFRPATPQKLDPNPTEKLPLIQTEEELLEAQVEKEMAMLKAQAKAREEEKARREHTKEHIRTFADTETQGRNRLSTDFYANMTRLAAVEERERAQANTAFGERQAREKKEEQIQAIRLEEMARQEQLAKTRDRQERENRALLAEFIHTPQPTPPPAPKRLSLREEAPPAAAELSRQTRAEMSLTRPRETAAKAAAEHFSQQAPNQINIINQFQAFKNFNKAENYAGNWKKYFSSLAKGLLATAELYPKNQNEFKAAAAAARKASSYHVRSFLEEASSTTAASEIFRLAATAFSNAGRKEPVIAFNVAKDSAGIAAQVSDENFKEAEQARTAIWKKESTQRGDDLNRERHKEFADYKERTSTAKLEKESAAQNITTNSRRQAAAAAKNAFKFISNLSEAQKIIVAKSKAHKNFGKAATAITVSKNWQAYFFHLERGLRATAEANPDKKASFEQAASIISQATTAPNFSERCLVEAESAALAKQAFENIGAPKVAAQFGMVSTAAHEIAFK